MDKIYNLLSKIWYNPKFGFSGPDKLHNVAIKFNPKITMNIIKQFIKDQEVAQLTNKKPLPHIYNTITASSIRDKYQLDIMVYDRFEFHNYKYIICCIDVYSRYLMTIPLTNRRTQTLIDAVKVIFDKMGICNSIYCDNEFNTIVFNKLFHALDIQPIFSDPNEVHKNSIVERVHYTIARILQRWRLASGRHDWYKILPDITTAYNNTYHKTIHARPIDVFIGKDYNRQLIRRIQYNIKLGDVVRIPIESNMFSKGDKISFSKQLYIVTKIDGIRIYVNVKETGQEYKHWFKPYQLLHVNKILQAPVEVIKEHEIEHQQIQHTRKVKRNVHREGIEPNYISLQRSQRERKPIAFVEDSRYGHIKY